MTSATRRSAATAGSATTLAMTSIVVEARRACFRSSERKRIGRSGTEDESMIMRRLRGVEKLQLPSALSSVSAGNVPEIQEDNHTTTARRKSFLVFVRVFV